MEWRFRTGSLLPAAAAALVITAHGPDVRQQVLRGTVAAGVELPVITVLRVHRALAVVAEVAVVVALEPLLQQEVQPVYMRDQRRACVLHGQ